MKKIKLTNYSKPTPGTNRAQEKLYTALLGNNVRLTASNQKDILKLLAAVSAQLTELIIATNTLYISVFTEYRRLYFYLDRKNKIADMLLQIEKSFNLLFDRQAFENGNYFTLVHMASILSSLQSICGELLKLSEKRNFTMISRQIDQLYNQAAALSDQLADVGRIS